MMKKMLMVLVLMPLMALAGTLSFEAESSNPSVAGGLWIEAVDLEDSLAYESLNQRVNAGEKVFFNGARPVSGFTQIKQIPCCCFAVKMTGSQSSLVKVDFEVDTPLGTFTESVQDITGAGFFGGFSMDALFNLKAGTYTLRATASADGCRPVTTAIKFTVKGTGRTVRNSLGYISNDIVIGALGGAGCSLQSEDGWIGVSGDSVVTACLGNNDSAQLLVHYDRPVFIVFNAAMVGDGDEFSVTVTGDGFSPSRYELSSGKGYYVGCIGQDGRSGGTILWQYKRGSSKLLLQDMHYSELYNFRCYDVIKVSFDSAGGGTVPPILAVCSHAYNAIEQFPENGPTPPKSKNGEEYEFEGWYNGEGVRVTGNSMVPEYSDDHTLTARWKVAGDEKPDLYIATASASPVTIMLSERTAIKYTLVNGGKKSAGQTSTYFVADTCWTSLGNGPLAAGASETCTKHISGRELGLGTHQILIQADAPNDVEESNEDNNSYYVTVVVVNDNPQPYVPSVQTVRVSFDPDGGKVEPTSYEYTVGSPYGWFPMPTRDGYAFLGWSHYRDGYMRKKSSDIVSADVRTLYAVWAKGQDLKFYVPDGISASFFLEGRDMPNSKPNVLTVGDTPILRCYIANAGVYSVKGFKVAFKFQGKTYYNKKWVDREIGAGDWSYLYETEDFLRGLGAGTYSLTCIIDSENSVQEVDEGNNEQTIEFCVMPLPPVEVRFDPKGGIVAEPMRMVDVGGVIGVLPVPVRDGFEFVGWFTAAGGGTRVLEDTVVTADMVVYAHWRLEGEPVIVPGEKVEIDTGLVGYTVSGLPTGLKYDKNTGKITGAATKPTAAEGVVVKFTKSGAETEELTIVVTAIPKVSVAMEGVNSPSDTDGCKVTGAGAYLVGKTVTLKATAPKGVVFMGWVDDEGVVSTQATYSFTMGKENVALVARFKKEVMSVGCEVLSTKESFPAGVLGAEGGIRLDISTESGVKSVKVEKLPAGMKYDAKTGLITGAPTKAGDNKVVITVTAQSGAVAKKEIEVSVAAMPVMAVGKFDGFVSVGEDNLGTFTLTTTDAGKLTAKVVTAAGAVSFSGTCWDAVVNGVYRATLTTKKGERLALTLDTTADWDANQLTGSFTTAAVAATKKTAAVPSRTYAVSAQRNAFGKTWYFAATGDEQRGWTLSAAESAKVAALTVTLKADGTTALAGKLPGLPDAKGKSVTFKVSASGAVNLGGIREGALMADFAPVLTINKVKKVLSITTNLWLDRTTDHTGNFGGAKIAE